MVTDLGNRGNGMVPGGRIIHLEGVIEPILPHPERDRLPAHLRTSVCPALCDVDRRPAHRGVRMGERTELEPRIGVVTHRNAIQREPRFVQETRHLRGIVGRKVIREIQVRRAEPTALSRGFHPVSYF